MLYVVYPLAVRYKYQEFLEFHEPKPAGVMSSSDLIATGGAGERSGRGELKTIFGAVGEGAGLEFSSTPKSPRPIAHAIPASRAKIRPKSSKAFSIFMIHLQ
jgi:hypothetical protein